MRRLALSVAVLMASTALAAEAAPPDETKPRVVGRVPMFMPPSMSLGEQTYPWAGIVTNPATRRGYQWLLVAGSIPPSTFVTAFDLDTLAPLRSVMLPYHAVFGGPDSVDALGGRIFFAVKGVSALAGIGILDERLFLAEGAAGVRVIPAPTHPAYASVSYALGNASPGSLAGIRYEPSRKKLLLALGPQRQLDEESLRLARGRQLYANFVAQWDVAEGGGREEWVHPIRECSSGPIGGEVRLGDTPFLSADGKAVQLLCGTGELGWQFVSLPLGADGKPTTQSAKVFPAPNDIQQIVVDAAGQRTHLLANTSNSSYGATFDWAAQRLVGTFAVSQRVGANGLHPGIDPTRGRLYLLVPSAEEVNGIPGEAGGLLILDGRGSPLPQALAFRHFKPTGSGGPPAVDWGHTPPRVFARATDKNMGRPYYDVIEDPVPVGTEIDSALVDQTDDIVESERTTRSYAGEASGYGSRTLLVGGVYRGVLDEYIGACTVGNREVRFGAVTRSGLASVGAFARADVAEADLGTKADAQDLGRCWPDYNFFVRGADRGLRWPGAPEALRSLSPGWAFKPAECSGDGEGAYADPANAASKATVTCDLGKERVDAGGTHRALSGSTVSIAKSTSTTRLRRTPDRGVVATVESVAEGVVVDGVGSIGAVRSFAETYAKGRTPRPGDPPRATWTVQVCGVQTASFAQDGCRDPKDAVAALNEAGRGRVVVTRPAADPALLGGTPGGYLAAVQRDRGEAAVALVEHGDDSVIVPGLEIQVRNTVTTGAIHRYVFHLAGVRAASVYGISALPSDVLGVPEASFEAPPPDTEALDALAMDDILPTFAPTPAGAVSQRPTMLRRVLQAAEDVVRDGLRWFRRNAPDMALMAGLWSTFGVPAYLAIRRRRLTEAAG